MGKTTKFEMKPNEMTALKTLLASSIALGALSVPALAQDEAQESTFELEEIQVTARRRSESLQDVPIAVSAFSSDMLKNQGIQDIVEVAKFAPNLTLEVSRGTNTTLTAFIRGVGQQDPVAGFEAGVGLYVDDIYLNRPQAAVVDIYDVERIEVLRGPQGTLYGRNTIGGAVKYVTKRLSEEAEFNVRGSIGTYEQLDLVVSASAPISDGVRIGGALATLNRGGFGENLNIEGLDNYHKQVLAGRASIEFLPSDELFIRFAGDFVDDKSDPRQGHRLIPGAVSGAPVLDNVFDTRAGLVNPEQSVEAYGGSALIEWAASDTITIKNILAYREDKSRSPIDFDSLPVDDLDVPVDYQNKQFSEEFQILYEGDKLSGVAGFYYLDANAFNEFDVILGPLGDIIGLPGLNANTLGDVDTKTWSVFGDFSYDLSDQFSLSVGGRYTSDKRTAKVLRRTFIGGTSETFGGDAILIATTSDFTGTSKFTKFTPRASISWKPNDDNNIYFSYSEGFKGGGFDPRSQTTAAPDLDGDGDIDSDDIFNFMAFDSESVDTFELGWKASLADKRVDISIAGFLSSYTNIQIPGSVGTPGNFIGVTSNAGDADVNGVEFEGRALLAADMSGIGDTLNINWAVGYLDATFNEFIDAFGVDVADQRVFQNTPEWTASGSFNYTRPMSVGSNSGALSVISSVSYRSKASQFERPNALLDQPGFALWDASLVWNSDDDQLSVGLHAKNITNKRYIVAGYNFVADGTLTPTLGTEGTLTAFYGNPFTLTATVSLGF